VAAGLAGTDPVTDFADAVLQLTGRTVDLR
jgi:hypothetical protein